MTIRTNQFDDLPIFFGGHGGAEGGLFRRTEFFLASFCCTRRSLFSHSKTTFYRRTSFFCAQMSDGIPGARVTDVEQTQRLRKIVLQCAAVEQEAVAGSSEAFPFVCPVSLGRRDLESLRSLSPSSLCFCLSFSQGAANTGSRTSRTVTASFFFPLEKCRLTAASISSIATILTSFVLMPVS